MATSFPTQMTCAVCAQSSKQLVLASASQYGSPDLDTRPAENLRSTLSLWIQRCPGCGYCAPTLTDSCPGAGKAIRSGPYLQWLRDPEMPELAASFECSALLQEATGNLGAAAWASIHGAWACDDAGAPLAARQARLRSIERVRRLHQTRRMLSPEPGLDQLVVIDLLRRAGEFSKADRGLRATGGWGQEHPVETLVAFQRHLVQNQDAGCYTIEDANWLKRGPAPLGGPGVW